MLTFRAEGTKKWGIILFKYNDRSNNASISTKQITHNGIKLLIWRRILNYRFIWARRIWRVFFVWLPLLDETWNGHLARICTFSVLNFHNKKHGGGPWSLVSNQQFQISVKTKLLCLPRNQFLGFFAQLNYVALGVEKIARIHSPKSTFSTYRF